MGQKYETLKARVVVLPADDVDTDQIIPARFLKVTDKAGLGEKLFCDWRYLPDGSPKPEFPLNRPDAAGAQVLVAGVNFGCGSSREHAPWALVGWGLRAIVARSFADIFKQNALKNGLLPIEVDDATHAALVAARAADPSVEVVVDLEKTTLTLPDGKSVTFTIDPFAQKMLLNGLDELSYLQSHEAEVEAYERRTHL
jgi:3-isopropylmalate/(R)-2-methylmalate dehydratase small subunit